MILSASFTLPGNAAVRISLGTSLSQRSICCRSSDSSCPASVGEKSFSSGSSPSPQAEISFWVVWLYSPLLNGSPRGGRWYFTDGTAMISLDRVRSAAARTRLRYSSNERSHPLPFQVTVHPSRPLAERRRSTFIRLSCTAHAAID